jgi:hypothetical protein
MGQIRAETSADGSDLIAKRICCQPRFEGGNAANVFHDKGMVVLVELQETWYADGRYFGADRRLTQKLETFGLVRL